MVKRSTIEEIHNIDTGEVYSLGDKIMHFINKETLEVKTNACGNHMLEMNSDWEPYPYDEYDLEIEYLKFEDNGDTDYGDVIKYIINPTKTVQEITDDLKAIELKHSHHLKKYDYISFEVSEVEDCDLNEDIFLIPVGVYRPTKERALAWYKEKIKVQEINKKNQIESDLRAYERYKKDMSDVVDRLKKNGYEGELK